MSAMAAANESEQQAAAGAGEPTTIGPATACPPVATLDPQLLMAARRGDSKLLKDLLPLLKDYDDDDQQEQRGTSDGSGTTALSPTAAAATGTEDVIVEVDPRPPHDAVALAPPSGIGSSSPPVPVVLDEDGVTMEGDSLLHVVAACGDTQKYRRCATMIVHNKKHKGPADAARLALEARNRKGDTPLHCAAGAGNAGMIVCLVELLTEAAAAGDKEAVKTFLRMKNRCGETALHQAVRAASEDAIDELLSVDPELVDAGAAACSPFFLAVSLWGDQDDMDIARHLFDKTSSSIRSKLSYYCSGPDGRNVLHAAVSRASVKAVVLLSQLLTSAGPLLLSQLASQRDMENGSTPLHLAASLDGLPSTLLVCPPHVLPPAPETTPLWPSSGKRTFWYRWFKFCWFPVTRRNSCEYDAARVRAHWLVASPVLRGRRYWQILPLMLSLVLNANEDMVYQPDKAGMYPIHVAAGSGSVDAVEMLLERCPDCATLRDAKGRTLLHVAIEEDRFSVVDYVCCQSSGFFSTILNAQDMNGDTPLHRAVHAGHDKSVRRLIGNQKVRLDVPNNVGMTPLDVSWTTLPREAYYAWDSRMIIRRSLLRLGAPYGENIRGDLFRQKCVVLSKKDQDEEKKISGDLTAAAQVLALFSVLITTVTFASAFTLPGGNRSAGDAASVGGVAGTPVLGGPRRSYAFEAFILADALAFVLSLLATTLLLYAGVPAGSLDGRFRLINMAYGLMWQAGRSLLAAFGLGLFIVLLPVARSIAIVVVVLMILLARAIMKESEGFNSMGDIPMIGIGRRSRQRLLRDLVLGWIILFFNLFWSYVLIFGIPAIRRWPKFTLSPY